MDENFDFCCYWFPNVGFGNIHLDINYVIYILLLNTKLKYQTKCFNYSTSLLIVNLQLIENTSNNINLSDIFITVKTSKKFHEGRIHLILQTWYNWARKEVSYKEIQV